MTGPNGAGKSALLSAITLLSAAAEGAISRRLAAMGGMGSALWAGPRRKGPVRMILEATLDESAYALELGLPRPTDAALELDPIVKSETISARVGRRSVPMLVRRGPLLTCREDDGRMSVLRDDLWLFETALANVVEPLRHPEADSLRRALLGVRLYDPFRVDAASPLRQPYPRIATPTVSGDGADWAAALYSAIAIRDGWRDSARAPAHEAIAAAFEGAAPHFFEDGPDIEGGLTAPEFQRPFRARELSDGTLRFLALAAALTALRPPSVILLNEPEASLHARMIDPLADLIAHAAVASQVIVVTHERRLADRLEVEHAAQRIALEKVDGATGIVSD